MIDKFEGKYAFLSNFYPSPIKPFRDNITYPTVEHAFQACKTMDFNIRQKIADQPTPGKAKRLGRAVDLRPDWNLVKENFMYYALKEKFKNSELRKQLLDTGDEELIEGTTWHDNIWGNCSCPKCKNIPGQNRLGKLLMQIREEIKNSQ